MTRTHYAFGWGYVVLCVILMRGAMTSPRGTHGASPVVAQPAATSAEWFRQVKPYCNPVEIGMLQRLPPHPKTIQGAGYHAACFALAGRVDDARRTIDRLQPQNRAKAAGIVFNVAHPVADAGDDKSAGPIMEMVVDYWPTHYMALYHAGMAEYMLGQRDLARKNLRSFLEHYHQADGWTANAKTVLKRLDSPVEAPLERVRDPGS